ncbi:MAG: PIG-L family deacetylase [Bdellovibrionota bacterium]
MPAFYSPSGLDPSKAKSATRILAIGAHPDDLEFMCLEPIARSAAQSCFGGLIVTSGSGSIRSARHVKLSAIDYAEVRWDEQKTAARLGHYAFVDSLNFESADLNERVKYLELVASLRDYLTGFTLDELYLHQPFDRHASHVRVCFAVLEALRQLPLSKRPAKILGCEVWRNLDWAPKSSKLFRPLGPRELELQKKLAGIFVSQADPATAKNYVEALVGRKTSNAVFQEGLTADAGKAQEVYLDLGPWVSSDLSWLELGNKVLEEFKTEATSQWPLKV